MPQPMDEGTVLGGRYLVTSHVLTSADQDIVLYGRDQVLNRDVAILVASQAHASQVATSARQLATGERQSNVQVLDLGLSDDRTYLIASGDADVQELLALVTAHEIYVEPFETDTLGSELFGESRPYEPETYEDDDAYYSELDQNLTAEQSSPARKSKFLNRISEGLNSRLGSDAATGAAAGGAAAGAGAAAAGSAEQPDQSDRANQSDQPDQPDQPEQPADGAADDADNSDAADVAEDSGDPTAETPEDNTGGGTAPQPKVSIYDDDSHTEHHADDDVPTGPNDTQPTGSLQDRVASAMSTGAAAGAGGAAGAGAAGAAGAQAQSGQPSPAEQDPFEGYGDNGEYDDYDDGYEVEYADEEERSPVGKWIGILLLLAVLIAAVILAFNTLGSTDPADETDESPVAEEPTATEGGAEEEPSPTESEDEDSAPEPAIAGVERSIPGNQDLNSENDGDLPLIVDGNPATAWHSLSFAQPALGGLASNMAMVVELEEESAVSEINITQNNGSGGSFQVMLSDSPDLESAEQVAEGSFTGPTYSVPVQEQEGEPATAQYVIVNITELPTLSSNSGDLPYGLRLAEIEVN